MSQRQPLPTSAAHAFVTDLDTPELLEDDHHHLTRVLRLTLGQTVTVSDGAGRWRACTWRAGSRLEPVGPLVREPTDGHAVTVAFALTKGDRPEWVVQKLTEIGVDRIVPFRAAHSIVRWDEAKSADQVERWRRVARQASMQSRRIFLPEVADVADFDEVAKELSAVCALAAPGGEPPTLQRPALLVGPEGGWAPEELACGLPTVGLGPTILRAETAAVAAAVVLCGLRQGTVRGSRTGERDGG